MFYIICEEREDDFVLYAKDVFDNGYMSLNYNKNEAKVFDNKKDALTKYVYT